MDRKGGDNMEKDFQSYLIKELDEIKGGVHSLSTEFQDYKTTAAGTYITRTDCSSCAKDKKDGQKGFVGWIIGAYAFIMTVAIAMFTTMMRK